MSLRHESERAIGIEALIPGIIPGITSRCLPVSRIRKQTRRRSSFANGPLVSASPTTLQELTAQQVERESVVLIVI
jgi:hypothetical protein